VNEWLIVENVVYDMGSYIWKYNHFISIVVIDVLISVSMFSVMLT